MHNKKNSLIWNLGAPFLGPTFWIAKDVG